MLTIPAMKNNMEINKIAQSSNDISFDYEVHWLVLDNFSEYSLALV